MQYRFAVIYGTLSSYLPKLFLVHYFASNSNILCVLQRNSNRIWPLGVCRLTRPFHFPGNGIMTCFTPLLLAPKLDAKSHAFLLFHKTFKIFWKQSKACCNIFFRGFSFDPWMVLLIQIPSVVIKPRCFRLSRCVCVRWGKYNSLRVGEEGLSTHTIYTPMDQALLSQTFDGLRVLWPEV